MSNGRTIPSWSAYIASLAALMAGFIYSSLVPAAPYEYLTWGVVGLAGAYFAKRVADKKVLGIKGKSDKSKDTEAGDSNDGGLG